ncbi:NAD-dependent protein deacetylase, SIR2 family [Acidaminobacter sp. JC074]|uniref:SIR2 family NAD-dependent protein deacylase n=1 Tax=Acidaminobacter sp. JC074 TaxID=2530199 RepID=UPI001F0E24C5|nr:Sir2 family NAD-dependent protein deacetylase [Acidaminobacter sp. JC074]MCH4888160.1 NAD-dependent protein deacetylase, SIR2 family [Acidaminobacter sp. JC074]
MQRAMWHVSIRMNINTKASLSSDLLDEIIKNIDQADRIVIGAGAGLSASAGLNYNDEGLFKELYPLYARLGYKTISDGIAHHWYLREESANTYWGFWARHIYNVYYRTDQLEAYKDLYDIVKDKHYFVITTNADGQFFKGGFSKDKIFSMQGSYGKFQCSKSCHETLYDNKEDIYKMLEYMGKDKTEIRTEDIPRCKECGELLCPNLRIDHMFVEAENLDNREAYIDFIDVDEKIVLLELGVGYNTPVIIRYPFDELSSKYDNISLIRVNPNLAGQSHKEKGNIYTNFDAHQLIQKIKG